MFGERGNDRTQLVSGYFEREDEAIKTRDFLIGIGLKDFTLMPSHHPEETAEKDAENFEPVKPLPGAAKVVIGLLLGVL